MYKFVVTANGKELPIKGVRIVHLVDKNKKPLSLPNTFYVPKLITNLVSNGQLVDKNCTVNFHFIVVMWRPSNKESDQEDA